MSDVSTKSLREAAAIMRSVGNGNKASLFDAAAKRIDRLQAKVDALMLEHCPDEMTPSQIEEWAAHQVPVIQERMAEPSCDCHTCRPVTLSDMRFVVCSVCGNKRCPKANDHRHECSGSNESGQKGSAWEHVTPTRTQEPTDGRG